MDLKNRVDGDEKSILGLKSLILSVEERLAKKKDIAA